MAVSNPPPGLHAHVAEWQTRQLEVLVARKGRPGSNPGMRTQYTPLSPPAGVTTH